MAPEEPCLSLLFSSLLFSSLLLSFIVLSPGKVVAQGTTPCGFPYDVQVNNATMSSLFPGGGAWASGTQVYVTDRLTVDQSTTFSGITFIMGSNAMIEVKGTGVMMTTQASGSQNTQFIGCVNRWKGVSIHSGGSINLSGNTIIKDAWRGLFFAPTANATTVSISNTQILNCVTGIFVYARTTANPFSPALFSGVTIKKATQTLLPPPSGTQDTYTGDLPWHGIYIGSAVADLATNAVNSNTIRNTRYGVYASSATVSMSNCLFDFNRREQGSEGTDGTGFWAQNSFVTISGCTFFAQERHGVFSSRTRLLGVTRCTFTAPERYGIRVENSQLAAKNKT